MRHNETSAYGILTAVILGSESSAEKDVIRHICMTREGSKSCLLYAGMPAAGIGTTGGREPMRGGEGPEFFWMR